MPTQIIVQFLPLQQWWHQHFTTMLWRVWKGIQRWWESCPATQSACMERVNSILYITERIVSDSERVLLRDNLMPLKFFFISISNTLLLSELMNDLQLLWLKILVLWQNLTTSFLHMTFWLLCLFGYMNFQKQNALFWMCVDIEMFDFHESCKCELILTFKFVNLNPKPMFQTYFLQSYENKIIFVHSPI